jgi:two-component system, OmpR family, phosphate regulon response regulator PhoB
MADTIPSSPPARQRVALLVDSDADTRRMYAEYLRLCSAWLVDEASDGREALAKAISQCPAVLVTETRLPGMSGFDLCQLLRSDNLTAGVSIIVVTGDALENDIRRARMSGADTVLVKPCLPERLHAEIERIFWRGIDSGTEPGDGDAAAAAARPETATRHFAPPAAFCPSCDALMRYVRSHVGGVRTRAREQWDYFECTAGCGTFQYRQRTRKLRKV